MTKNKVFVDDMQLADEPGEHLIGSGDHIPFSLHWTNSLRFVSNVMSVLKAVEQDNRAQVPGSTGESQLTYSPKRPEHDALLDSEVKRSHLISATQQW